jgi:diacylglycerol O-acyltransferase
MTGLSTQLSPVDHVWYRLESSPRSRLGILGVAPLDTTPDWNRFRTHFENGSRRVLRLRQKVVVPTLPTTAPRWVVDPDFDLDFHVRRVRLPEPGTLREAFDLAEAMLRSPLDVSRPLWAATLVEGLADGTAAVIFNMSHAIGDGLGSVDLLARLCDLERDPLGEPPPPPPVPQHLSPNDLMRVGLKQLPGATVRTILGALSGALSTTGRVALNPPSALGGVVRYVRSTRQVMRRVAQPSPLLRGRSLARRTDALDIRLSDLQKAASAGGSINDAYLAGLCGALRRYHEALGVEIATLPMAVPVNLRAETDPDGGNRVAVINLAAPVGTADPVARMRLIHAQMTRRSAKHAKSIGRLVTPLLTVMPLRVLETVPRAGLLDAVATNVPCYPHDTYLAGAKVLRQYGFGPLAGAGMMVTLLSTGEWCTITVRYDSAAIRDEKLFAECLLEGFDEILALAGEPRPHAVLASLSLEPTDDELAL